MRENYDDDELIGNDRSPILSKKINKFITLKAENGQVSILVGNKKVGWCTSLILNISPEHIRNLEKIDSIDEAAEVLNRDLEYQNRIKIPLETEFWGHCSNMQAWEENGYDTRILHSNLAFPLLRELTNVGDPTARRVFKEEIASRFTSKYLPVALYLYIQGYLDYLSKSEFETLLNFYEDLSKIPNMRNPDIWAILGICYRFLKLYDLSESAFKKALTNSPGNRTILINLAEIYYSEKDFRKVTTIFRHLLEKNPNDIYILEKLADVYLFEENYVRPSIVLYEYILRSQPENLGILLHLALAYSFLGKNTKSMQINLKILEKNPKEDYSWVNLGINYFDLGDFKMAKRAFLKALEFNDSNYKAGANLIRYFISLGNFEKAFSLFKFYRIKYHEFAKEFKNWDVFVLECLIDLKRYKEAQNLFNENFKFTLDSKLSTFYDGKIYFYMKNYEIAEKDFDYLLSEYPKFVKALYYKASIKAKKNEIAKSLELLKKIDKLDYKFTNYISFNDNFKDLRNVDEFIEFFNKKFSTEKIIIIDDYGTMKLFKLNNLQNDGQKFRN